jgi:hypothetical protein
MSERACIAVGDYDRPKYHRIGRIEWRADGEWFTACGHPISNVYGIKSIRREHAALWASPCRICFKEDDDDR